MYLTGVLPMMNSSPDFRTATRHFLHHTAPFAPRMILTLNMCTFRITRLLTRRSKSKIYLRIKTPKYMYSDAQTHAHIHIYIYWNHIEQGLRKHKYLVKMAYH